MNIHTSTPETQLKLITRFFSYTSIHITNPPTYHLYTRLLTHTSNICIYFTYRIRKRTFAILLDNQAYSGIRIQISISDIRICTYIHTFRSYTYAYMHTFLLIFTHTLACKHIILFLYTPITLIHYRFSHLSYPIPWSLIAKPPKPRYT